MLKPKTYRRRAMPITTVTAPNIHHQFDQLGRRQLAIADGLMLLRETQAELARTQGTAAWWGHVAILANAVLVPLNVIVNAFELKTANSLYKTVVKAVYDEFAASGSRTSGGIQHALKLLKSAIVNELSRKAMTDQIPVANILVGLVEDSVALWQTIDTVSSGSREIGNASHRIRRNIQKAAAEIEKLGIRRADLYNLMQQRARIA
ncbi:MAG: hypothetical protein Rubg2KO_06340 [Rubricoccaceae bacterium]